MKIPLQGGYMKLSNRLRLQGCMGKLTFRVLSQKFELKIVGTPNGDVLNLLTSVSWLSMGRRVVIWWSLTHLRREGRREARRVGFCWNPARTVETKLEILDKARWKPAKSWKFFGVKKPFFPFLYWKYSAAIFWGPKLLFSLGEFYLWAGRCEGRMGADEIWQKVRST